MNKKSNTLSRRFKNIASNQRLIPTLGKAPINEIKVNKHVISPAYKKTNMPNKGYAAQLIGDSGPIIIIPGETKEVWAEFKNTGTKPWDLNTKLGTIDGNDRSSKFIDNWISGARIASVVDRILPGANYRFIFNIKAPINFIGTIIESFGMVQEGIAWFQNPHGKVSFNIKSTVLNDNDSNDVLNQESDINIMLGELGELI
jgi:hypothetical protein